MIRINPLLEDQLKKRAVSKNVTLEQLVQDIMTTHSKTSGIDTILLEEKEAFIAFVLEYRKVVDDMFVIIDDIYRTIDEQTNDEAMKNVFEELFFFISRDLSLFVYLFRIYQDQNKE